MKSGFSIARRWFVITARLVVWLLALSTTLAVWAADDPKPKPDQPKADQPKADPPKTPPAATDGKKIPKPEDVTFDTRDRVRIAATWYAAVNDKQKETVPVILVHGYKGNRREYQDLALALQSSGFSALAIDLRGHGESTMIVGRDEKIALERLTKNDFALMWEDIEAAKKFIMDKNEDEQLNIDRLSIVAAEMGGTVALQWATYDLTRPFLAGINKRQGQWLKAVVMLSPVYNIKGYSINPLLNQSEVIRHTLPLYVVYGKGDKDSEKIAKQIDKARPAPAKVDETKPPAPKTLVHVKLDTSLSSVKLLSAPEQKVTERIVKFLELHSQKPKYPWDKRRWD